MYERDIMRLISEVLMFHIPIHPILKIRGYARTSIRIGVKIKPQPNLIKPQNDHVSCATVFW